MASPSVPFGQAAALVTSHAISALVTRAPSVHT